MLETDDVALLMGYVAMISLTIQYFPQALLNFRRSSVYGFSIAGVIFKYIGACFLAVDSALLNEPSAVIVYGIFNISQHLIFIVQFYLYPSKSSSMDPRLYLAWFLFPLFPYILGAYLPATVPMTMYIKPISQIASLIPQVIECIRLETTLGVSILTQHLNTVGGLSGLYMCYILKPVTSTYVMYANCVIQALFIYSLAGYYGELADRKETDLSPPPTTENPEQLQEIQILQEEQEKETAP
eukprot:TRINITY_DN3470_c0_g1_i3.p1 TRINITY_DN3470_c0_g1~~TRINITY_DN3470_c0_g1_i3.p1  ORF type:complete len:241 (+),score=40.14 TRINITY_DN3470_c0_g1_i3:118-840(+)